MAFSPLGWQWLWACCKLCLLCIPNLYRTFFLSWRGVKYFQRACLYLMRWSYGISFNLFIWGIAIDCSCMLSHPCISERKPIWSSWLIFLMCCWIQFPSVLLRTLTSILMREIGWNSLSWLGLYVVNLWIIIIGCWLTIYCWGLILMFEIWILFYNEYESKNVNRFQFSSSILVISEIVISMIITCHMRDLKSFHTFWFHNIGVIL